MDLRTFIPSITILTLLLVSGSALALGPDLLDGAADLAAAPVGAPDADALDDASEALPAGDAPDVDLPAELVPLRVTRQYIIIDVVRTASALGRPVEPAAVDETVPRFVRVATVDILADQEQHRVMQETADAVRTDRRPGEVGTGSAVAAPASADAPAVAMLLVAGLATQAAFHGVVAMYHRIAPAKALQNRTREAVHREVTERGVASITDVARAVDVHPKTVKYHLDLLVKFHLLVRDDDGAYRPPGVPRSAAPPVEETILELVERRPGINMTEVARALDMSKSTAQEKVTSLLVEGRLESRRASRARLLFPSAA